MLKTIPLYKYILIIDDAIKPKIKLFKNKIKLLKNSPIIDNPKMVISIK